MRVKNIVTDQRVTKDKLAKARQLLREMTSAEKILWLELRRNKLSVHFRRQQIIAGFIVDFYCNRAALVIESDGEIHAGREQKQSDIRRDATLQQMGLRLHRFTNEEVLTDLSTVIVKIEKLLADGESKASR